MRWQDKGYLLTLNKYNENSAIAEFFTENNGKINGVIFGANSKKIKNYLLIGNKFHINYNFKQDHFSKLIAKKSDIQVVNIKNQNDLKNFIKSNLFNNEMIICMGAGSISNWIRKISKELQ